MHMKYGGERTTSLKPGFSVRNVVRRRERWREDDGESVRKEERSSRRKSLERTKPEHFHCRWVFPYNMKTGFTHRGFHIK